MSDQPSPLRGLIPCLASSINLTHVTPAKNGYPSQAASSSRKFPLDRHLFPGGRRCGCSPRKGVLPALCFAQKTNPQICLFAPYMIYGPVRPNQPPGNRKGFEPDLNYFAFGDISKTPAQRSTPALRSFPGYPAPRAHSYAEQARSLQSCSSRSLLAGASRLRDARNLPSALHPRPSARTSRLEAYPTTKLSNYSTIRLFDSETMRLLAGLLPFDVRRSTPYNSSGEKVCPRTSPR